MPIATINHLAIISISCNLIASTGNLTKVSHFTTTGITHRTQIERTTVIKVRAIDVQLTCEVYFSRIIALGTVIHFQRRTTGTRNLTTRQHYKATIVRHVDSTIQHYLATTTYDDSNTIECTSGIKIKLTFNIYNGSIHHGLVVFIITI